MADTNTAVDRITHRALLESSTANTPFEVTVDNVDMFTAIPPIFDATVSTVDCNDSQGKHNLVVTLPQIPTLAGTYQAIVTLTVSASDV